MERKRDKGENYIPRRSEMGLIQEINDLGHIAILDGKEFIRYAGLIYAAKKLGLTSSKVKILRLELDPDGLMLCICQATVKGTQGKFRDIGDATPKNVNRRNAGHFIRIASTRAKARALRDYVSAYLAIDPLGDLEWDGSTGPGFDERSDHNGR